MTPFHRFIAYREMFGLIGILAVVSGIFLVCVTVAAIYIFTSNDSPKILDHLEKPYCEKVMIKSEVKQHCYYVREVYE